MLNVVQRNWSCRRLTWAPGPGGGQQIRAAPQRLSGSEDEALPCVTEVENKTPEGVCSKTSRLQPSSLYAAYITPYSLPCFVSFWIEKKSYFCRQSYKDFSEFSPFFNPPCPLPYFYFAFSFFCPPPPRVRPVPPPLCITSLQGTLRWPSCWVPPPCKETLQWILRFRPAACSPPGNWCPAGKWDSVREESFGAFKEKTILILACNSHARFVPAAASFVKYVINHILQKKKKAFSSNFCGSESAEIISIIRLCWSRCSFPEPCPPRNILVSQWSHL